MLEPVGKGQGRARGCAAEADETDGLRLIAPGQIVEG